MKDSANFAKTRLKMKCIFFYTALRVYIKTEKIIVFIKRINKEDDIKSVSYLLNHVLTHIKTGIWYDCQ